ncbi:hypothetical protein T484DRAFT_2437489 [Baffinella frigidus]|nr:hypothetical protein T484DRAFT_2437489 [Cryptophyta sp. CCMP2293]
MYGHATRSSRASPSLSAGRRRDPPDDQTQGEASVGAGQGNSGRRRGGPSPGRSRGRPSPGRSRGEPSPGRPLFANDADDGEGAGRIAAATWRLSLRVSMSKRARRVLRAHPSKSCGQLPVIPGLEVFTIRSLGLTSLRGMGVHPEVRQLFAQSNLLVSFEGFEPQHHLLELHAEDNLIESFRGLPGESIEAIWLAGNPIAESTHYRTMAIAACGRNLKTIDGERVRRAEVLRALSLGKAVAEAIRDGWVLAVVDF